VNNNNVEGRGRGPAFSGSLRKKTNLHQDKPFSSRNLNPQLADYGRVVSLFDTVMLTTWRGSVNCTCRHRSWPVSCEYGL